jgi:hypothetical protein
MTNTDHSATAAANPHAPSATAAATASDAGARARAPALFAVPPLADPPLAPLTEPVDGVPAFWLPAVLDSPTPGPAPLVRYFCAADGMAGRRSAALTTQAGGAAAGHVEGVPLAS